MPSQVQLSSAPTRLILIRCRRQGRPPLWVFFFFFSPRTSWILKSPGGDQEPPAVYWVGWGGRGTPPCRGGGPVGRGSCGESRAGAGWEARQKGGGELGRAPGILVHAPRCRPPPPRPAPVSWVPRPGGCGASRAARTAQPCLQP